jgi:hypothetical protein
MSVEWVNDAALGVAIRNYQGRVQVKALTPDGATLIRRALIATYPGRNDHEGWPNVQAGERHPWVIDDEYRETFAAALGATPQSPTYSICMEPFGVARGKAIKGNPEATASAMADACPHCGESRAANPELFTAGQTLCDGCAHMLREREETTDRELSEGRFHASGYHAASRLLSASDEDDSWEWSHSHTCPGCLERWTCSSDSCEPGPMECQHCEELTAAESVAPPEGYVERPMTKSDLAVRDLGL